MYFYSQSFNRPSLTKEQMRDRAIARAKAAKRVVLQQAWKTPERTELLEKAGKFYGKDDFITKMIDSYYEWGTLTVGQEEALVKAVARRIEWASKPREADANSQHISTVGTRTTFDLKISKVIVFASDFGTMYIHIMKDMLNNVVIYKGSKVLGADGATINAKATVKAHGEREGTKQTILTRPVVNYVKEAV